MDSAFIAGMAPEGWGMLARTQDTVTQYYGRGFKLTWRQSGQGVVECNVNQPSQAALPSLDYPFQMKVADYCKIKAKTGVSAFGVAENIATDDWSQ